MCVQCFFKFKYYEVYQVSVLFKGDENYDNQKLFGQEVFNELARINRNGYYFDGKHHQVKVVCCCDWKAAATLQGYLYISFHFAN